MLRFYSSFNSNALYAPFYKLPCHISERHPLYTLVLVDVLDDPLMHENHLWLPTNLRMYAHREDEGVVLAIREIELLLPQPLDDVRIDEALRASSSRDRVERRPVV